MITLNGFHCSQKKTEKTQFFDDEFLFGLKCIYYGSNHDKKDFFADVDPEFTSFHSIPSNNQILKGLEVSFSDLWALKLILAFQYFFARII